jgi:hypothetical protein
MDFFDGLLRYLQYEVLLRRHEENHKKWLRNRQTGREGIIMLPFLSCFLVNHFYGSDLNLQDKLFTVTFVNSIVGVRIIKDVEKSESDLLFKGDELMQHIEGYGEFGLTDRDKE